jgi:hypothetical protein
MPYFGFVLLGFGALCLAILIISICIKKIKQAWIDVRYLI